MRRIFPVAILSALVVAAPAAIAQRGAAGHAGGFSGGHSSGFSGHSFSGSFGSSGRISSAPRSFSSAPYRSFGAAPRMNFRSPAVRYAPGYRTPYGSVRPGYGAARPGYGAARPGYGAARPGYGNRDRYHYRPPYRGYGIYPYNAYANSWELLPWDLGYPDFTGYDNGYNGYEDSAQADQSADYAPPGDPGDQQPSSGYAGPWIAPHPAVADSVATEPELRLVFLDGHQQAIRNYLLTSNTVIVMDQAASGRQQQIPLAQLNLPATQQAAQQAGLQFTPPS
jgi:hypothetical protein